MATISDLGDTYDLPNFVGDMYSLFPNETPLITMAGVNADGGGQAISTYNVTWQDFSNAAPAQLAILEGADPSYREESRTERENVTQIFQRGVELSWTKHSAVGKLGPYASSRVWSVMGDQPVQDEDAFQVKAALDNLKRQMNWHAWNSAYVLPTVVSTGRQTRGLLNAVTTNKIDNFATGTTATFDVTGGATEDLWTSTSHGLVVGDEVQFTAVGTGAEGYAVDTPYWVVQQADANTFELSATKGGATLAGTGSNSSGTWTVQKAAQLTRANIENLIRTMGDAASPAPFRQPVFFAGGVYTLQRLSELYGFAPQSRTLGGVAVTDLMLDKAGTIPVVHDRDLPTQVLFLADMSVIEPHWLITVVRGEVFGALFYRDVAHTGSATRGQIYGDMGLAYGPEGWHGWVEGLTTAP